MSVNQGEVVLITFPFFDLSGQKLRPALVLSTAAHLKRRQDVIVAPLTSQRRQGPEWVEIGPQDMKQGRLKRTSYIKVDRITRLSQSLIRYRVGRVDIAFLTRVVDQVNDLIKVS